MSNDASNASDLNEASDFEDSDALAIWLRDALPNLFDLDFLKQHMRRAPSTVAVSAWPSPLALQDAILAAIEKLRPGPTVSIRSEHWRLYQILSLRYLRDLSQAETADEMNLSVRQLRREQTRAIRAAAALLALPASAGASTPARAESPETQTPAGAASAGDAASALVAGSAEVVHCEPLLRAAIETIDPLLRQHGLHVQTAVADGQPAFRGDPMIARQLVLNALMWMTHARAHVVLTVRVDRHEGQVQFLFLRPALAADAGADADTATNDAQDASLENARTLAAVIGAHCVRVAVDAESGNEGLRLLLPANPSACILVVDDNIDAIRLVRRYLAQNDDYTVVTASTPEEALHHALSSSPAAILLDIMLPQRDGWEILTLLKARPDTAGIPVVISSVLQQPELGRALGAAALLPKPFDAEQLLTCLRQVLRQTPPAAPI
jgi:CheY-like chemotaxis protein